MYGDEREAMELVRALSVADHTHVIQAVLESSLDIGASLARTDWARCRRPLAATDAMRLVAQCESIDERAQDILNAVAVVSPLLRLSNPLIPSAASREVMRIALETASIDDLGSLMKYLEGAPADKAITDSNILHGLSVSLEILRDGASTIYDADYFESVTTYSKKEGSAKEDAKDLGKADVAGAVVGALGGAAVAGVGAGPGALAGGVGASTAKAVEKVVDAIVDWLS